MELHDFGAGTLRFSPITGETWRLEYGEWTRIKETADKEAK